MLKHALTLLKENKNILMLASVSVYLLAVFSVLSGHLLLFSAVLTFLFILFIACELIPIKIVLIWALLFYVGVFNMSCRLKTTDELFNLAPANSTITGTIISIPQGFSENKPKFFFKVKSIKINSFEKKLKNEKVLVTLNSYTNENYTKEDLKIYNSYTLKGRLSVPFKAGNPSQFDYGNYLRNYDTYAVFYAKNVEKINSPSQGIQKYLQKINDYRESIISVHSEYLRSPNAEILGGIVFGDDAVSPPKDIKQSFINSGLLHILAASGMNVAFIYGFFFTIMSFFRVHFKVNILLSIAMIFVYCLMTGMGASVVRATLMLAFVLIGKLIDRDAHSISLLSFVAFLMLLYNPLYINDVGFQLSFVVTLGILITSPLFVKFKSKLLNSAVGSVTIPIIAQLWVIPIQIFYFSNISLYAVLANIISVPILSIISFCGFVSSLLAIIIPPLASKICYLFDTILNPLLTLLVNISDFWGNMSFSAVQTTHPAIFQILLYYILLLSTIGLCYKECRKKYLKPLLVAILATMVILALSFIQVDKHNLEITTFDVGNADCFMIKTPDKQHFFIDTGKSGYDGGKSQAEIVVLKYLKDVGIKNINSIILTHFDSDHSGGAVDFLKNTNVKNLYVNNLDDKSLMAKEIYKTAKNENVKVIKAENTQVVHNSDGVKIVNFISDINGSDNDKSIITLLSYNDFNMLFTGDAGINGINSVIKQLPKNITVLKVPHHGAVGGIDKDIIKYLNPKYSIISVGENKFGHPSPYTLALLKNSNTLRTDIMNSILIKVSNKDLEVLTYDMSKKKYIKIQP